MPTPRAARAHDRREGAAPRRRTATVPRVTEAAARIDAFPFGLTWVMREAMLRASHAVAHDGRVWIVDPVDHPAAIGQALRLGAPAAVVQLIDRHSRDCAAIATRLGVPHLVVPDVVPDSPFRAIPVLRVPGWRETALWWGDASVLVVGEVIGTAPAFTAGTGVAGLHPFARALPPGALRGLRAEHLLVGHGPSLHGAAATTGVEWSYARARRDVPRLVRTLARMARG